MWHARDTKVKGQSPCSEGTGVFVEGTDKSSDNTIIIQ